MTRWLLLIGSLVTMTCVGAQESVELRLTDAIALALRDNRAVRGAYLQRVVQRFDLRVAADQFAPQLSLHARYLGQRNQADRYRQAQLTPSASLLTPYGTRLSLDWTYDDTRADDAGRRYSDGANLTIIQPLLRGAGRAIATAPPRRCARRTWLNRSTAWHCRRASLKSLPRPSSTTTTCCVPRSSYASPMTPWHARGNGSR